MVHFILEVHMLHSFCMMSLLFPPPFHPHFYYTLYLFLPESFPSPHPLSGDEVLLYLHGSQLSSQHFEKHGFSQPIMINKKDGLGLKVPSSDFQVADVERYVGEVVHVHVYALSVLHLCDVGSYDACTC